MSAGVGYVAGVWLWGYSWHKIVIHTGPTTVQPADHIQRTTNYRQIYSVPMALLLYNEKALLLGLCLG